MLRPIYLLGVPSEMGALNGTSGGPQALLSPLRALFSAVGQIMVYENVGENTVFHEIRKLPLRSRGKVHRKKHVAMVADLTASRTGALLSEGRIPLVLGGDHSVAMGSARGALEFARREGKKIGLIWIDAHYDAHTEKTTQSGNANGMPLASLLGFGPHAFRHPRHAFRPEEVVHLGAGATDCEPEEKALLDTLGVELFSAEALRRDPIPAWIAILALVDRVDLVWVSLDLDAVDHAFAPGVHLPSDGGLDRTLLLWLAGHMGVGMSGKLCGVDIMEYKPASDEFDSKGRGKTAILATDFLRELFKG